MNGYPAEKGPPKKTRLQCHCWGKKRLLIWWNGLTGNASEDSAALMEVGELPAGIPALAMIASCDYSLGDDPTHHLSL